MSEEYEDLAVCMQCKKPHWDFDIRCPECGAGLYWQCGPEDGTTLAEKKELAKQADILSANRLIRKGKEILQKHGVREND